MSTPDPAATLATYTTLATTDAAAIKTSLATYLKALPVVLIDIDLLDPADRAPINAVDRKELAGLLTYLRNCLGPVDKATRTFPV